MAVSIFQGNAEPSGAPFNGWFVGDLRAWSEQNGIRYDPERMGLRDTPNLEVKWGVHPKGQQRPGGWAGPSEKVALSLLVSGGFLLWFREPGNPGQELAALLRAPGDYVVWREEFEHTWQAVEDSIVLTVRWKSE